MTVTVLDTATSMAAVLDAAPAEREDRVRAMLAPAADMFRYFPGEVDLAQLHTMSMGFPLDRELERVKEALERFRAAEVWTRMHTALEDAIALQRQALPGLEVPDVMAVLILGDPTDEYFMHDALGLSGNGAVTGYLMLTVWPTEKNLERIEASVVHELNHNLRYAPGGVVWDPATVTVGEHVVGEGLADAFAREMYGDRLGYSPFGVQHLDDDAVFEKVVSGLAVTGMENFGAWVIGDAAARRFGATPVGLPTGAGYAVGNRLVDTYLAATDKAASEALHVPSEEIITTALRGS
ncbi:MAG TPA: DUF2268 domain-containing protein [Candidatus Ruania gallistercoris]|uniref:DUF2268 domain-containing protein n=1 Tax=Candidatus Ruania gallistercoris TaxID=2838746 RepID=A0A9D2J4Z2_9MICO|nr:DUF2268 domain-containing protein [Candidatus Ruania gallistercoris]